MLGKRFAPISRIIILLLATGIFQFIAFTIHPSLILCQHSLGGTFGLAFILASARSTAIVVSTLGYIILRSYYRPWYARPWAILFLVITFLFTSLLVVLVHNMLSWVSSIIGSIPKTALICQFTAVTLFWIIVMDWPTLHTFQDREQPLGPRTKKPKFKPFTGSLPKR